tara:strand:+ start:884 stop:2788 length:1905 start_codon:yes stop_codon:yes gene_type:complete
MIRVLLMFFFFYSNVYCSECLPREGKQSRKYFKILKYIEKDDFFSAKQKLKKYDQDHISFYALKSHIMWKNNKPFDAQKLSEKVIDECPVSYPICYYILAEISYGYQDYVNCSKYLKKAIDLKIQEPYYSKSVEYFEKSYVISKLIDNDSDYDPKIVNKVSTEADEYLPILSPDQSTLYFTRRFIDNSIDMIVPTYEEQFSFSYKLNDTTFSVGSEMPLPFNKEDNEGGASINIDNSIIYYTKCSRVNSYNNCDIFYSIKKNEKWGDIVKMNDKINLKDSWESQPSISIDGKKLFFASNRKGGYGGIDIYYSVKINGKWSAPINLGPEVNSSSNEKSPFLHSDNQTLFFSSDRYPSIGKYDIFISKKDSAGNWQKPTNLGYPINTKESEISLVVSTDGDKAYFASNEMSGVGGWDLYSFSMPDKHKPKRVLFLSGDLTDENGKYVDYAKIEIFNLKTQSKTVHKAESGKYALALTLEKDEDVILTLNKDGYAFNSNYISSNDKSYRSPKTKNFQIKKLENGKSFKINDILFEFNSFKINLKSISILSLFSQYLKQNKDLVVTIEGHTDNVGNKIENLDLSKQRAKSVYDYLIQSGVEEQRLDYDGFGEEKPVASNDDEKGRALNRRTEFKVLKR